MKSIKFDDPHLSLYVKSMGKLFKVTAICKSHEEANKLCEKHSEMAMVAIDSNGLIYLAEQYAAICPSNIIKDL